MTEVPTSHQYTSRLQAWLASSNGWIFSVYAIIASFSTYSAMYAFRRGYAVATFEGLEYWGIDYKILLITTQVIGYCLSKFIGIKIVSEMKSEKRAVSILGFILFAGVALFFFAIVPKPYNIIFLFLNGLPLGMIWGLVFSYLEGRRFTEVLGAGLSVSFIFSSGFIKTAGTFIMNTYSVSEFWMPFLLAAIFTIPLFISVYLLNQLPPPTELDEKLRTARKPMTYSERKALFIRFAPGLVLLILVYVMLTVLRDFRDNFAPEIWASLGYGGSTSIYTISEIPISLFVLIVMGSLMVIKNNFKALIISHIIIALGVIMIGVGTYLFQLGIISPLIWMVSVGAGTYMGYVPFNSMFFDRLIATFKYVSNVGFLIYLADSFGYLGSVSILFYKNFAQPNLSWLDFFVNASYIVAFFGTILMIFSMIYFSINYKRKFQESK